MTAPALFEDESPTMHVSTPPPEQPGVGANPIPAGPVSLYRKYRPQSFAGDEVVGQDHVVRTLRNAIALDRVAHAYLFSGPRGTGKTTMARLLAKAVNCLDPDSVNRPCNRCRNCFAINAATAPDIIEIDAASNRGIDDIRDLRERVRYAPAVLSSKVYIIDEAHQITGAAANAFLKTLEEPPSHTRFVLATTDPEELLPTIVSRCQRFEFRRISLEAMARRLQTVSDREGIAIESDALRNIARHATGSLRDALGLLEQLAIEHGTEGSASSRTAIRAIDVRTALGLSRNDRVEALVTALHQQRAGDALHVVQEAVDAGEDPRQLNKQFVGYLRLLLHERAGGSTDTDERARSLAAEFSLEQLAAHARRFSEIDFSIKHAPYPQLPLEVALVEATAAMDTRQPAGGVEIREELAIPNAQRANGVQRPSLRDRVRNQNVDREAAAGGESSIASRPVATVTAIDPHATEIKGEDPKENALAVTVERLVDLWPHVRADVKVLNRRIEALLSEVDPVAISGSLITLAVPYPFHRDKLNTDDVRDTISGVLSRQLGRDVTIACVLRGELEPPARIGSAGAIATAAARGPEAPAELNDEDQRAMARLQAAKTIFDAEEIEPISLLTSSPSATES